MWISKRKWNEMEDRVNELEKRHNILTQSVYSKIAILNREISQVGEFARVLNMNMGKNSTVNTSNIKDITLKELARLVIDREPIVREENVKVKVEYTGLR